MASYNKRISDQSKIKFDPINRELIDSENSELDTRVDSLEGTVGDSSSGLVKDVNDLETDNDTINGNLYSIYKNGAKNLIPLSLTEIKRVNNEGTWVNNEYTLNGVTFTINVDDNDNVLGISTSGTAIEDITFFVVLSQYLQFVKTGMNLSGCPSNGNENTYFMEYCNYSGVYYRDFGEGVNVEVIPQNSIFPLIQIVIKSNQTVTDKTFYPMFRLADDSFSEFQPYAMTNLELTNKVADLESRVYALEHPTP